MIRSARAVTERWNLPQPADPAKPAPATSVGTDAPPLQKLSAAEARVAALATEGHTNREIAGRLFVTVSTVEQQLTRIYRKLAVNGRADLAACFVAYRGTGLLTGTRNGRA